MVDLYLEFVAGRVRPNTLRAVAFDLKTFFTVVVKDPVDVVAADIFEFLADQRGDRSVIRLSDGESGMSARTIARRLSSVSGFYSYVIARGDTSVVTNPVPRGLSTRRQGGRSRSVPLVRVPHTLPRILSPGEVDALLAAMRTDRDRAMVLAMVLGGLRRCEVLGLRLGDIQVGERSLFIAEGKGGRPRVTPISNVFFSAVGDYLRCERPPNAPTDRVFVTLKGPSRGRRFSAEGVDVILTRRSPTSRTATSDLPSAATHLPDPPARSGHGSRGRPGPGRPRLDRVDPDLPALDQRLAGRRIPPCLAAHRCRASRRTTGTGGHQLMTIAAAHAEAFVASSASEREWADLAVETPMLVSTMRRYLTQLGSFLAPRSVDAGRHDAAPVRSLADRLQ